MAELRPEKQPVPLEIRAVQTRRDLRAFVDLPYRLYANEPHWIPPLRLERRLYLSRRLNPYFRDGDAQLFLALRDGRIVGRISAQVDHAFNRQHGSKWGAFGFVDVEDDADALAALLDAADAWLRERRCERMVGPMEFTMNDGAGVLVEGYDIDPVIREPWQPPYLRVLFERCAMEKAMDLFMWELDISDREHMLPVLSELAEKARTEHGVTIRRMSRRSLRRDLDAFADVYNAAWARNWDFRPYSKADLDAYALDLQLVFERDWFMVAEAPDGDVLGVAITIPDVNQVLKRMGGRLAPFGWWRFLRRARGIDGVRVGFLGVKPEHQHTGVAAALYVEHFDTAERHPRIKGGEMGWILETNVAMNRAMEAMHGRVVKRYRMYERRLGTHVLPAFPVEADVYVPSASHGTPLLHNGVVPLGSSAEDDPMTTSDSAN